MKVILTYENREVKSEFDDGRGCIEGMSDSFRAYIEEIASVYRKHMELLDKNPERKPESKLELTLKLVPREQK